MSTPLLRICVMSWLLTACSSTPQAPQRVALRAMAHAGAPLGGVRFILGGKLLGETKADGSAVVEISGETGKPLPIQGVCPPEYRSPTEPLWVRAGAIRSFDEKAHGPVNTLVCEPLLRSVAVVVSSHGVRGCPILVDGALRGETDASGVAHLLLQAAPESVLQLELRGPRGSEWRKARTFRVHDEDDLLIMSEDVSVPRRKGAGAALRPNIYRIQ